MERPPGSPNRLRQTRRHATHPQQPQPSRPLCAGERYRSPRDAGRPSIISGIIPLLEHTSPKIVSEHGGSFFQLPSRSPLEVFFELASDRSRWLRACALYAIGQVGGDKALPLLERRVTDPYELARLNAIEAIGNLAGSAGLSLLERLRDEAGGRTREYSEAALGRVRARVARSE